MFNLFRIKNKHPQTAGIILSGEKVCYTFDLLNLIYTFVSGLHFDPQIWTIRLLDEGNRLNYM